MIKKHLLTLSALLLIFTTFSCSNGFNDNNRHPVQLNNKNVVPPIPIDDSLYVLARDCKSTNDTIVLGFIAGMSKQEYNKQVKKLIGIGTVEKHRKYDYILIDFQDTTSFLAGNKSIYLSGILHPDFINNKLVEIGISFSDGGPHPKSSAAIFNTGRYIDYEMHIDSMKNLLTSKYGTMYTDTENYYWVSNNSIITLNNKSQYPDIRAPKLFDRFDVIYRNARWFTRELNISSNKQQLLDSLASSKESSKLNNTKRKL